MKWDIKELDFIVKFINLELSKGRAMTDIEKEEFDVNSRVIHKRLERQNYKRINNQYILKENYVGQAVRHDVSQHNLIIEKPKKKKEMTLADVVSATGNRNKLVNLLDNYDKIMELISKRESNIGNKNARLVISLPNEEGKKDFRVTVRVNKKVMDRFNSFAENNKMFTKKELISQALLEFIEKYEND
ncbi:MAG: hypothetical protein ACRDCB_13890 [Clostridium sp.]